MQDCTPTGIHLYFDVMGPLKGHCHPNTSLFLLVRGVKIMHHVHLAGEFV